MPEETQASNTHHHDIILGKFDTGSPIPVPKLVSVGQVSDFPVVTGKVTKSAKSGQCTDLTFHMEH